MVIVDLKSCSFITTRITTYTITLTNLLLFNDPFMTLENHHRGLIQSSLWLYLGKLGCNVSIHFILWTIIHHYLHRFFIPLHSTKTFEVLLFVYVWDNLWYCFPYASSGHPCSETQHFSMAILLQQASQSHGSLICRDKFAKVNLFARWFSLQCRRVVYFKALAKLLFREEGYFLQNCPYWGWVIRVWIRMQYIG